MKLNDKYIAIVDQIINKMESENLNISKMLNHIRPMRSSGEMYRGINLINLMLFTEIKADISDYWFTFLKAKELGAKLKKGSKSLPVFYFGMYGINENGKRIYGDNVDEEKHKVIKFMRVSPVFNANLFEGLDEKYYTHNSTSTEIKELENYFNLLNIKLLYQNTETPHFDIDDDLISMPEKIRFTKSEYYYAVLFHEVVHWTGHKDRLNRKSLYSDDKESYAFEELVAEIGATFLCSRLGIESTVDDNHVDYLNTYIKILKNDKRLLMKASSKAQEAVDYIFELFDKHQNTEDIKLQKYS